MQQKVFDLPTAAKYIDVANSTMYRYRCEGTGPRSYKIKNVLAYDRDDLDDYLAAREEATSRGVSVAMKKYPLAAKSRYPFLAR
jgi:predicted DNA-binding transcriptional regulator AlpA